jgi:hypothetical protein
MYSSADHAQAVRVRTLPSEPSASANLATLSPFGARLCDGFMVLGRLPMSAMPPIATEFCGAAKRRYVPTPDIASSGFEGSLSRARERLGGVSGPRWEP